MSADFHEKRVKSVYRLYLEKKYYFAYWARSCALLSSTRAIIAQVKLATRFVITTKPREKDLQGSIRPSRCWCVKNKSYYSYKYSLHPWKNCNQARITVLNQAWLMISVIIVITLPEAYSEMNFSFTLAVQVPLFHLSNHKYKLIFFIR